MTAISTDRRQRGRIVLISCYELGQQPLGITVPAGVLARAGLDVDLIDVAVEALDEDAIAAAGFVGISAPMHTALRLGLRVAARVREINPGAHICFYGLYAALNSDRLRPPLADSCLGAEFESDLLALAASIVAAPPPRPAPTVSTRRGTRDLNLTPNRSRLRHPDRYARLIHHGSRYAAAAVTTTRGCKYRCRHCPLPAAYDGRFFAIDVQTVMDDVATLVESGTRHITFADPDFLNGPTHARRVARELHARFPGLTFDYTAKIEHLIRHRDLVEELQSLGNIFVISAVESLNDGVLVNLDKGHTRNDVISVIRHFREIGLALRPSLMPFTPWETRESYLDLLETIAKEELIFHVDPVHYGIRLLIPPGSLLLRSPAITPFLGDFDGDRLSYRWSHPDPAMDELQRQVAEVTARAADDGSDVAATFHRVLSLAAGRRTTAHPTVPASTHPPGLTEAWFC